MTPDELRTLANQLRLAYNVGLLQPMLDAADVLDAAADRDERAAAKRREAKRAEG